MTDKLRFSVANVKVKQLGEILGVGKGQIFSFSLPSGFTCPFADKCLSFSNRVTGKVTDGANTEYRCFGVTMECRSTALRALVWHNLDLLKLAGLRNVEGLYNLIKSSIPAKAKVIRVHVTGDYLTPEYFQAWLLVAKNTPEITFYGYTKAVEYIVNNDLPSNFILTASVGGKQDNLITSDIKSARVVYSYKEAEDLGLEIDHNEEHALIGSKSFALLIHGTQPKGSKASKAKSALAVEGYTGYH